MTTFARRGWGQQYDATFKITDGPTRQKTRNGNDYKVTAAMFWFETTQRQPDDLGYMLTLFGNLVDAKHGRFPAERLSSSEVDLAGEFAWLKPAADQATRTWRRILQARPEPS